MRYFFIIIALAATTGLRAQNLNTEATARIFLSDYQYTGSLTPVDQKNKSDLFDIYLLEPAGFIIISKSQELPPVPAWSFTGNPDAEGRMIGFMNYSLRQQFAAYPFLSREKKAEIQNRWSEISLKEERKLPQYWPPLGSTPTEGWVLTQWSQNAPYNWMCPMDLISGSRSIAGCPSIAMAQIVNFHRSTNQTRFDDSDDYHHVYAGRNYWIDNDYMTIEFPSFPELNVMLDSLDAEYLADLEPCPNNMAALVFACGVACTQVYTSSGSGTFGVSQAADAFQRFACTQSQLVYDTDTSLFSQIIANIMDTMPVHLAIVDSAWSMGHNVVIDGYNSDNYFHINFGWGGSADGWYLVPSEMPYNLTVIEGVVLDIRFDPVTNMEDHCESNMNVFPNPAISHIYLPEDLQKAVIYNLAGIRIMEKEQPGSVLDISELETGMYILVTESEKLTLRSKFLKH